MPNIEQQLALRQRPGGRPVLRMRWIDLLFSADAKGRLYTGRVHHKPYEFGPAELGRWSFRPAEADGFTHPGREPDHVWVSKKVEVEAWMVRRL